MWVPYILGTTAHTPGTEPALPQDSQVTYITCITGIEIGTGRGVTPRETCSGTLFQLHNLFLDPPKNIDVSPFNFPIPRCKLSNVPCHISYWDNTMSITGSNTMSIE